MSDAAKKVETLMEAMPYLAKYQGKVIVIKYGGNAMINDELKDAVLHDVVMLKLLGLKPVLSHGGGPGINRMLEKLNIPVQFINGLRYTSEDIMRVVEMVLVGQVNTELVGRINQIGGKAVGLSGVSGDIYHCHKRSEELGFVGDIDYVNADAINAMLDAGFIPVIAPVGTTTSTATPPRASSPPPSARRSSSSSPTSRVCATISRCATSSATSTFRTSRRSRTRAPSPAA